MIKYKVPMPKFHLVGTASKFVFKKKGKVKSFELKTSKGNFYFKIPHKLHKRLNLEPYPNIKLEVKGKADVCRKKAKIKLKLEEINVLSPDYSPPPFDLGFFNSSTLENSTTLENSATSEKVTTSEKKGKILICKKSSCRKRGGKEIYDKITEELRVQGLDDSVTVKKTGCMGRCKSAPNLVVLPGKNRYHRFNEEKIQTLIETHFVSK